MRWKRVAWAGWLAPALGAGCHTPGAAGVPALPSGALVGHTQAAIEHRIRTDAATAWRAVRAEHPRRCFTAEFRDGFIDGYTDHLDRGGDGTPPPTPPLRYSRHPRYFTPEGHALLKDYFLGFKYGADVAAATGQRQFLTVPVLVPDGGPVPHEVVTASPVPTPPSDAPPAPLVQPRPLPTTNARPVPRPTAAPGSKFDYGVRPVAEGVTVPVSVPAVRLPAPPPEVPTLPPTVPTPPVTDELPTLPPSFELPAPLPPNHPDPAGQ
jgi:hypothetical protein